MSLDGTLGKIALRTRSAPRQLLQVTPGSAPSTGHALLANLTSANTASSTNASDPAARAPLSHRSILMILEQIYEAVLDLEQLRRIQPALLSTLQEATMFAEAGNADEVTVTRVHAAKMALEQW